MTAWAESGLRRADELDSLIDNQANGELAELKNDETWYGTVPGSDMMDLYLDMVINWYLLDWLEKKTDISHCQ